MNTSIIDGIWSCLGSSHYFLIIEAPTILLKLVPTAATRGQDVLKNERDSSRSLFRNNPAHKMKV